MYYFFLFLLLLSLIFFFLLYHKRKQVIKKICAMKPCDKCNLLEQITAPFGYCYCCDCKFFTSAPDAWQKQFGYTALYDKMASHFQMVFDCQPVYFNYNNKTWLIEFWKGQYGINTGAEIGIYHADTLLSPADYDTAVFFGAGEEEMLPCSFHLYDRENRCIYISQRHWWLTAFLTGCFSEPSDLSMDIRITFPNCQMLSAFTDGIKNAGYPSEQLRLCGLSVSFPFDAPVANQSNCKKGFWCYFSQLKNKIFCKLYLWITKPFCETEDRILYLYYLLPFAFRKTLRLHRFRRKKRNRRTSL